MQPEYYSLSLKPEAEKGMLAKREPGVVLDYSSTL